MPDRTEHLSKYRHNKEFLKCPVFEETKYLDWAVVVVFYSALHLIEAFFAGNGLHFQKHKERAQWVSSDSRLKNTDIPKYYHFLYNQSIRARYEYVQMNGSDLQAAIDALTIIEGILNPQLGLTT